MAQAATLFVSKRLQRMFFAYLLLAASQFILASCDGEPVAMAVRAFH